MPSSIAYSVVESPLGAVIIAVTERGLCRILLCADPGDVSHALPNLKLNRRAVARYVRQIEEYFDGKRREFDLPLDLQGTPFQQRVWMAIRGIPYGETRSYGRIAEALGKPGAARAVGSAANANPVPLVVPCHRVVGYDGSLVGYASGISVKKRLLGFEKR